MIRLSDGQLKPLDFLGFEERSPFMVEDLLSNDWQIVYDAETGKTYDWATTEVSG